MRYNTAMHPVLITKADGEREQFDPGKLEQSLERAGASPSVRAHVVDKIVKELRDGMFTEDIYRHAFELLRQQEDDQHDQSCNRKHD